MRAIDDPVQLAAGAAVFRRALARRASASAPDVNPPASGAVPRAGRAERRPPSAELARPA